MKKVTVFLKGLWSWAITGRRQKDRHQAMFEEGRLKEPTADVLVKELLPLALTWLLLAASIRCLVTVEVYYKSYTVTTA